jgi:hypothetical protein
MTAIDGSVEVAVGAAGRELQWILVLTRDARVDLFRVQVVVVECFGNRWRWVGVIVKVNKSVVLEWTLMNGTHIIPTTTLDIH